MTGQPSFRGNPQWDYRRHEAGNLPFIAAEGRPLDEIKRRALNVLRSYAYGEDVPIGGTDLEGPLWALVDVSHGSEAVTAACDWLRVASSYGESDGLRRVCCISAYGWIERALRCYL